MTKCPECEGYGQIYTDPFASSMDPTNGTIDCPECGGTGEIEDDDAD